MCSALNIGSLMIIGSFGIIRNQKCWGLEQVRHAEEIQDYPSSKNSLRSCTLFQIRSLVREALEDSQKKVSTSEKNEHVAPITMQSEVQIYADCYNLKKKNVPSRPRLLSDTIMTAMDHYEHIMSYQIISIIMSYYVANLHVHQ